LVRGHSWPPRLHRYIRLHAYREIRASDRQRACRALSLARGPTIGDKSPSGVSTISGKVGKCCLTTQSTATLIQRRYARRAVRVIANVRAHTK
jgi:hypothetical protein